MAEQNSMGEASCTSPEKTECDACSCVSGMLCGQLDTSDDEADFNHRIVLSDKFRNLRFRDTMNPVVPETFLFKGGCGGSAVFLCRS